MNVVLMRKEMAHRQPPEEPKVAPPYRSKRVFTALSLACETDIEGHHGECEEQWCDCPCHDVSVYNYGGGTYGGGGAC